MEVIVLLRYYFGFYGGTLDTRVLRLSDAPAFIAIVGSENQACLKLEQGADRVLQL